MRVNKQILAGYVISTIKYGNNHKKPREYKVFMAIAIKKAMIKRDIIYKSAL